MKEIQGNIWETNCNWLCITTNSMIKNNGRAVMGRGIALDAKLKYPDIDLVLADKLQKRGNIVQTLGFYDNRLLIAFPTKENWRDNSDIELIKRSAMQLKMHFDEEKIKPNIAIPRPGCGNGGLIWEEVRKILEPILIEDNFKIYWR